MADRGSGSVPATALAGVRVRNSDGVGGRSGDNSRDLLFFVAIVLGGLGHVVVVRMVLQNTSVIWNYSGSQRYRQDDE
ncbi:hypothetical protein IMZ48_27655 [Candidatus Bathyarchaeota archaeon]|nr:hypothetical protein [Candidatus Bathyarchaeota archaeon]